MQATYRNNASEVFAPAQFDTDSVINLLYRGSTFRYNRRSAKVSQSISAVGKTVTLIYRGMTYERNLQLPQTTQEPRVTNWRYQSAG